MASQLRDSTTDFSSLDVLLEVCEHAQKIPLAANQQGDPSASHSRTPSPTFNIPYLILPPNSSYNGYIFPTPPPTPVHTQSPSSVTPSTGPEETICVKTFSAFLDETWPDGSSRKGNSVIRASMYDQIAAVLNGDATVKSKIKHWVRSADFFLIRRLEPGIGYEATVAIPITKCHRVTGASHSRSSYKLVARVEDFAKIISKYHNDKSGHPGVRRTYKLVRELLNPNL